MKTLSFFFSLVLLAACAGCESDPPATRYDKIATGFCECTAQLMALNKQAAALANDTTGRVVQVFQQMQTENEKVRECSATIIGQYGKLKPEEFDAVQKSLTVKCPEMAEHRDLLQEMLGE